MEVTKKETFTLLVDRGRLESNFFSLPSFYPLPPLAPLPRQNYLGLPILLLDRKFCRVQAGKVMKGFLPGRTASLSPFPILFFFFYL